jgi:hypothetical protein
MSKDKYLVRPATAQYRAKLILKIHQPDCQRTNRHGQAVQPPAWLSTLCRFDSSDPNLNVNRPAKKNFIMIEVLVALGNIAGLSTIILS